jgi:hypothetical protein
MLATRGSDTVASQLENVLGETATSDETIRRIKRAREEIYFQALERTKRLLEEEGTDSTIDMTLQVAEAQKHLTSTRNYEPFLDAMTNILGAALAEGMGERTEADKSYAVGLFMDLGEYAAEDFTRVIEALTEKGQEYTDYLKEIIQNTPNRFKDRVQKKAMEAAIERVSYLRNRFEKILHGFGNMVGEQSPRKTDKQRTQTSSPEKTREQKKTRHHKTQEKQPITRPAARHTDSSGTILLYIGTKPDRIFPDVYYTPTQIEEAFGIDAEEAISSAQENNRFKTRPDAIVHLPRTIAKEMPASVKGEFLTRILPEEQQGRLEKLLRNKGETTVSDKVVKIELEHRPKKLDPDTYYSYAQIEQAIGCQQASMSAYISNNKAALEKGHARVTIENGAVRGYGVNLIRGDHIALAIPKKYVNLLEELLGIDSSQASSESKERQRPASPRQKRATDSGTTDDEWYTTMDAARILIKKTGMDPKDALARLESAGEDERFRKSVRENQVTHSKMYQGGIIDALIRETGNQT